jgi:hypothetical protein
MSLIYPQYQVIHGTYLPSSADFYAIQILQAPNAGWQFPDVRGFALTITQLGLQAAANLSQYPYAYVVGSGWANDAAAKAAAQADYAALITARNNTAAAAALLTPVPNNYVTLTNDSPVSGPG